VSSAAITLCVAIVVYLVTIQSGNFWIRPRVCPRFSVLCCPVYSEILEGADYPSKESFQMSKLFTSFQY
jgi:hypothetical protein